MKSLGRYIGPLICQLKGVGLQFFNIFKVKVGQKIEPSANNSYNSTLPQINKKILTFHQLDSDREKS